MNEFESDWISLRQSQSGRRVFWVNLREENKVSESHNTNAESRMAEFNMAKFKMATIIKLSQNEWVKFFVQMVGTNLGKYECVWEVKLRWLNPTWLNSRWQNSRWLPSSCWLRMNEFESEWISLNQSQSGGRVFWSESERRKQGVWIPQCRSWIQDGRIQDGRIQDGCHHQVNQNELVWVRVRVEGECSWVNLREDNKVSESKMAVS